MIRINLLPPEVLQKRQAESRRLYLVAIGLVLLALLGLVWAGMYAVVGINQSELAAKEQQAASYNQQANRYKIFEDRTKELNDRKAIAERAFAGRVDYARLLTEVSLVLPSDLWLDAIISNDTAGFGLSGWSLESKDNGFKSVAKLLVRLNDLEQLAGSWLISAEKSVFVDNKPAIRFTTTSKLAGASGASASASQP